MDLTKDIEFGEQINELEEYLKRKSIALIGFSDTMGYSQAGYNYLSQIVRSIKFQPTKLTVFNAHFRNLTGESHIQDLIDSNISIKEILKIQHYENEQKIEQILAEKHFPKDKKIAAIIRNWLRIREKEVYPEDAKLRLRSVMEQYEDVNIFYSTNLSLLQQKEIPKLYIEREMEQRKRNFNKILSINPNAEIYTLGLPCATKAKGKEEEIRKWNETYQKIASSFGMIYVNTEELKNVFKRDGSSYYLTDPGVAFLAFKCIEAMYIRKIQQNPGQKDFARRFDNRTDEEAIDYCFKRSIERQQKLEELVKEVEPQVGQFLEDRSASEEKQQKIYVKIKKEEDYFA